MIASLGRIGAVLIVFLWVRSQTLFQMDRWAAAKKGTEARRQAVGRLGLENGSAIDTGQFVDVPMRSS